MSRGWIAFRSIVYAILFVAAWGGTALLFRPLDKKIPLRVPDWLTIPGIALATLGSALAITTIGFFIVQGFGTPAVFDPPTRFVPHGPFRFVRNPMYIGGLTTLLGLSLYLKSIAMVLYSAGALVVVHTFVVYVEEPGLRKRFGQEYEIFLRVVPRWIPRLTPPPLSK